MSDDESTATTAAELVAQLAADPDYVQAQRQREIELRRRTDELRRAERPIVEDLRAGGVEVESVWDLVNISNPYPEALPILMKHLVRGGYPDRVMESLARALAVRPASGAWDDFRDLYLAVVGEGEMEGLAVALAASATESRFDELIALLGHADRGQTRIHFLRAIERVGGQRGLDVLASLREDPVFGREAVAILKERA